MGSEISIGIVAVLFLSGLLVFLTPEVYAHTIMEGPAFSNNLLVTDCKDFGFGDGEDEPNETTGYDDRGDADGDGICDAWEDQSTHSGLVVNYPPGTTYVYECGTTEDPICPSKYHKDIFVEVDWMEGHKLHLGAKTLIVDAFATVKNTHFAFPNPDDIDGINIHIQRDEKVLSHAPYTFWIGDDDDEPLWGFPQIKRAHFGTDSERGPEWDAPGEEHWRAKQQVFHYTVFVHNTWPSTASGVGEGGWGSPGNDFMISLGNFAGGVGSKWEKSGTFMHELGHNLGLDHGGHDVINCKPNYFSVMSHSRQMPIIDTERRLDFSTKLQGAKAGGTRDYLNETMLDETKGIEQSDPPMQIAIYGPDPPLTRQANWKVDWNRNGDKTDTNVFADINNFIILENIADCSSTYANPEDNEILDGHDIWDSYRLPVAFSMM